MELRFRISIEAPEGDDRKSATRAARQFLLLLAAEIIRASIRWENDENSHSSTT